MFISQSVCEMNIFLRTMDICYNNHFPFNGVLFYWYGKVEDRLKAAHISQFQARDSDLEHSVLKIRARGWNYFPTMRTTSPFSNVP